MKKGITIIVAAMYVIMGMFLTKVHADVYVKTERYHKPVILTEQQWKEAVGNSEVKEITANNFHFEIVNINGKRYLHYFDINEETYWKVVVENGR